MMARFSFSSSLFSIPQPPPPDTTGREEKTTCLRLPVFQTTDPCEITDASSIVGDAMPAGGAGSGGKG